MRLLSFTFFFLLCLPIQAQNPPKNSPLSYQKLPLDTLRKDKAGHNGIVSQKGMAALYDFQSDSFITQPAQVSIRFLGNGFYLVMYPDTKDFTLHFLKAGKHIHCRPQTELTVYYASAEKLGVTGQLIHSHPNHLPVASF